MTRKAPADIKALIEDAMGSDGILHVNDSSHFYRQLYTYAYQFYKYPRELLSEWGINYVYHWEEWPETESDVGQKNSIEVVASDVEVVTDYISPDFEDVMSELLQLDQILKLKKWTKRQKHLNLKLYFKIH